MAHALLLTRGMWHLRASIAALLLGIAIGLISTHGCAGDQPLDHPPLDDVDDGRDDDVSDPSDVPTRGRRDTFNPPAGDDDEPHDGGDVAEPHDGGDRGDGGGDVGMVVDSGSVDPIDPVDPVDPIDPVEPDEGDLGYYSQNPSEFFGASRCPSFVALCEDFENGMPSTSTWALAMTSNTVMGVDNVQHARGNGALHITLPPEPSEAYLRNESFFPREDDVVWGRLFFFVAAPGPDAFVHYNLVEATGPSQDNPGVRKLVRYGGVAVRDLANAFDFDNWLFNFEQRPRPSGFDELAIREDGRHMDRGAWRCMEFMFDGVASEARVFRDGVEVESARGESPLEGVDFAMPSFDGIHIGFAHYQFLDRGFDVWIDGLALDDERIGCSN